MNSLNYERLSGDKIGLSSVRVYEQYRIEFQGTKPVILKFEIQDYEQYRIEFQEVIEEGQTIATICNITELSNHYK